MRPGGGGAARPDPLPWTPRLLVAHRGASGYAPEHTLESYRLAIRQGADLIEPDLQITRDGVLVALHDLTLERTTDVRDLFPDRGREESDGGRTVRRWYASDFTLDELRRLDAGSWFGHRFRGARIPTLAEVMDLAKESGVGIFPETKAPEVYGDLGLDMVSLLMEELRRHGLDRRGAVSATPVLVQSFSPESLRLLRARGSDLHHTLLLSGEDGPEWLSAGGLARARAFADGVGPAKRLLLADPEAVERAHALGMTVIPWTFRATDPGDFPDVTAEMRHFLYELGVDGLFTDHPDRFPR